MLALIDITQQVFVEFGLLSNERQACSDVMRA